MSVTQTNARIAHCQIGFPLCRRNEAKQKKQYLGQTTFEYSVGISVSIQRYVCMFFQLAPVDPVREHPEVNGYFHIVI